MTRDHIAQLLCLTFWPVTLLAFLHTFPPLLCWLTGWAVFLLQPESKR